METVISNTVAIHLAPKKQVNLEHMDTYRNKKSSYKSRASSGNPRQLRVIIPIKTSTKITFFLTFWFVPGKTTLYKSRKKAKNAERLGLRFSITDLQMMVARANIQNRLLRSTLEI